jgi:hypothetical protein
MANLLPFWNLRATHKGPDFLDELGLDRLTKGIDPIYRYDEAIAGTML